MIGAEKLLNVSLPDYQCDMLERLWNHKNIILLCSRRTGKTFVTAVFLTLKAMLYPYYKIGIVAPVFRQAQTVFLEIEDLYDRSPFLSLQCAHEPKHGNTEWYLTYKNSSRISALPFSDKIRSKGYHIVFIDEYGYGDNMNQKVKRIIDPMLFTKREAKSSHGIHKTDIGNQMIVGSTATFKWHDYYKLVQEYEKEMREGSEDYDIISYDYRDALRADLFERQRVLNQYKNADSLTRQMEYENIFPDEKNGFITYKLLRERAFDTAEVVDENKGEYKEPETKVELEHQVDKNGFPTHEYIVAIDDADEGYDNFALAVIKLDGNVKRLVRIETLNRAPIQEKIKLIREVLRNYNVILITCDQRFKNLKDNLAEPYEYNDGYKGDIVLEKDDPEQLKYVKNKYGENCRTRKLLKIHNFTGKTNEIRARHFLGEIEKERFKIPVDPKGGYTSKQEEDIYNEIKKTVQEITAIVPKPSGRYTKYQTESRKQTKDRWTVCELGCYMADEYLKGGHEVTDIVIGI